jgi:hypothetical protein
MSNLIARRPRHSCSEFPECPFVGDICRCTECGQHWVRQPGQMGYGAYWLDISPRKVRSLIRQYERERAAIEEQLAAGPYDPLDVSR